jgi:Sulfotransferase family
VSRGAAAELAAAGIAGAVADAGQPVIHAGLPRTGTTTLQAHLFARHSQVHYLGVFKGKAARRSRSRSLWRDAEVEELMNELLFERMASPDLTRGRELWRRIRDRAPLQRKVWSWEGLSTDVVEKREARAANLARVLAPARVVITLRHPFTLLESTYFQILRRNNNRDHNPGWSGTVWYETIDEWLDRNWSGEIEPILDYERSVEIYTRHFGADAVRVLLYEELARDPAAYVGEVARILGVDRREALDRTTGRLENSTSGKLVETLRRARERPLGFLRAKVAVALELRGWSRKDRLPAPTLSENARRRAAERTRAGNRRLSERLGLDLARYDYPM